MSVNDWPLPCAPDTYLRVITCTNDARNFATLICTFIDVWAEDHGIDKVTYAAHIADMVKKKQERDKETAI